jgi:hypothetical protein
MTPGSRVSTRCATVQGRQHAAPIGMGLMLAALIIRKRLRRVFTQVGMAAAAYGVSYGFGYWGYGGKTCNEARALYNELDFTEETEWKSVWGADTAAEMKRLAEEFNNRGARRPPGESMSFSD